jgi:Domain of Unknown Function (DUF1259)
LKSRAQRQVKVNERSFDMEKHSYTKLVRFSLGFAALACVALAGTETCSIAAQFKLDSAKIEQLTGVKGELNEKEGVFTVRAPRMDLQVTTAGVKMNPAMGLTSYAAFMKAGAMTMLMGDTTLLEDQVNSVMSVALENGLEVTALHNHFFWDTPKVMFMHIGGMGDEEKLASAVGKVFAKIKETSGGKGEIPKADLDPAKTSLDPKNIEGIMGMKGQMANGVYKITIGRTTKMAGHAVGNAMGINTWAAFVGSDQQAVVDGDFVMLEKELQSGSRHYATPASTSLPFTTTLRWSPHALSSCITGASARRLISPKG